MMTLNRLENLNVDAFMWAKYCIWLRIYGFNVGCRPIRVLLVL